MANRGSMELTYGTLLTKGNPAHVHLTTVIASRQAVDYVRLHFPKDKITIRAASIDPD